MATILKTEPAAPLQRNLNSLDEVIHQKVRLGVMSTLVASGEADFKFLKDALGLTDGNLSIHIAKLEDAGYIAVRKEFVRKKPHTIYTPTHLGIVSFQKYLESLEAIVKQASGFANASLGHRES